MKWISPAVHAITLSALAALFYLHFSTKPKSKPSYKPAETADAVVIEESGLIAYVDIDSLEENYEFFKEKKVELEKKQQSIERQLMGDMESLQREAYELQQKAYTMTQSEGEAAEKRLYEKQAQIENKRDRLAKSFLEEQQSFNENLQLQIDSFLQEYNADKRYKFVFSYVKGGSLLYKDESFDITRDVINGMNERYLSRKKK